MYRHYNIINRHYLYLLVKVSQAYILLNICILNETDGSVYKTILCAVYTDVGSVEIKTEADSNDVMECRHDDMPSTGVCQTML